ncbi:MAG TPA: hypothetical protein PKO06_05210, partial [Candidatus Ozemobacteraceae bacterium]|nr:hypothetical protein [Candidatus Ozemobacteraceae bacterium]
MIGGEELVRELKQYQSICYYPSAGRDLSDIDYFASGCLPREERRAGTGMKTVAATDPLPDLYVHTDVNFYQEYAAGSEFPVSECGIHGSCEIVGFRELPAIASPNRICNNFPHSGRVFEYKLRVWNSARIVTLLYCLCENEAF